MSFLGNLFNNWLNTESKIKIDDNSYITTEGPYIYSYVEGEHRLMFSMELESDSSEIILKRREFNKWMKPVSENIEPEKSEEIFQKIIRWLERRKRSYRVING